MLLCLLPLSSTCRAMHHAHTHTARTHNFSFACQWCAAIATVDRHTHSHTYCRDDERVDARFLLFRSAFLFGCACARVHFHRNTEQIKLKTIRCQQQNGERRWRPVVKWKERSQKWHGRVAALVTISIAHSTLSVSSFIFSLCARTRETSCDECVHRFTQSSVYLVCGCVCWFA